LSQKPHLEKCRKSFRQRPEWDFRGGTWLWRQYAVGFWVDPARIGVFWQRVASVFPAVASDRCLPAGEGGGGAAREVARSAGLPVKDDIGGASRRALRVLAFVDELSKRLG